MLSSFHIIAFTHRNLEVSDVGKLHIEEANQQLRLNSLKEKLGLKELMFLSTCNRVEFLFTTEATFDNSFIHSFFEVLYPDFTVEEVSLFAEKGLVFSGTLAVEHILQVASSIDSMIVGEREIITQVRTAFDLSKKLGLTGDFIRLLMRHTVESAKRVYTETSIANKPVSVVALAYHTLRDMNIPLDARVLVIGAGMTNTNMGKFLRKHGYKNFTVFNRTLSKAENLAKDLSGKAFHLSELSEFDKGFDLIITCTGAENHIITPEIYSSLLQGETSKKVVIDIAIPFDLDKKIVDSHNVVHISVDHLQKISDQNLKERSKEIAHVEEILREALYDFQRVNRIRKVEIAMREVPIMVKDIKATAINHVFKQDFDNLTADSKEVLEKILGYMEKRYISVPMLMAKEILLKEKV
jgi:glutamyl-tRNA reductase